MNAYADGVCPKWASWVNNIDIIPSQSQSVTQQINEINQSI